MLPPSHAAVLADLLYTHAGEFVGVYEPAAGWFTHVNPAGVQLLGYPSEAVLLADPNHTLRTPPWTPARWQQLCEQTRREGHHELETYLRRYTGERLRAYLKLTPFEVAGQARLLVRLSGQSPLQQAERELAHSVRRFEAVVTHATLGIIVCDQAGRIVSANAHAGQQFGHAPAALSGQPLEVLVPEAVRQPHQHLRAAYNAAPQVRPMGHQRELQGCRADGSVFPLEASLSYFYLDEELYVVAYVLDLTAKKAAEQQLLVQQQRVTRLNAELERKVADRTNALLITLEQLEKRGDELALALAAEQELGELKLRFVSMASHEFRTPLTAVLSSADLIADYPAGHQQPQRLRHVAHIRASVQQLNDILEEFLSAGRLAAGGIEPHAALLDLPALLRDTVADLQAQAQPGQRISWQAECPGPVRLDASLLRKILVNLLSNALKYSPPGAVVTVHASRQGPELLLRVQDPGVGISAEDQTHLFRQFFRARSVATIPGSGLGLYIVNRYLELMGGTITVASALGQGTTITVRLPLAAPG